jgi:hypothetical protein
VITSAGWERQAGTAPRHRGRRPGIERDAYGYLFDDFKRHPWELSGGTSIYPTGTRSWRLNLHIIRVERSPAASNFGFYTAGQSGTTISIGTDILL